MSRRVSRVLAALVALAGIATGVSMCSGGASCASDAACAGEPVPPGCAAVHCSEGSCVPTPEGCESSGAIAQSTP